MLLPKERAPVVGTYSCVTLFLPLLCNGFADLLRTSGPPSPSIGTNCQGLQCCKRPLTSQAWLIAACGLVTARLFELAAPRLTGVPKYNNG